MGGVRASRRRPSRQFSDDNLICFVKWCRLNDERIVGMPDLVRAVMDAYARSSPPPATPVDEQQPVTVS